MDLRPCRVSGYVPKDFERMNQAMEKITYCIAFISGGSNKLSKDTAFI